VLLGFEHDATWICCTRFESRQQQTDFLKLVAYFVFAFFCNYYPLLSPYSYFNVSNGFWKLQSHLNICFIICFSNCTVSIITFHYIHILMYQINGFENGSLIWTLLDRSLMMGWSFFSLFGFLTALYLYFSPIHIFMYQMDSENGCLIWFCFFICFSSIIE